MINLIELNRQKRYIETKQALEALKVEVVEALRDYVLLLKIYRSVATTCKKK